MCFTTIMILRTIIKATFLGYFLGVTDQDSMECCVWVSNIALLRLSLFARELAHVLRELLCDEIANSISKT